MKKAFIIILLLVMAVAFFQASDLGVHKSDIKMNGVSYVAPSREVSAEVMDPIVKLNANWVAIIPYGYTEKNSAAVKFNSEWQYWGESVAGAEKTIEYAKSKGLKVLLKPHVWVVRQGWPGDFELNSEEDWQVWEASYLEFILTFALIAQDHNLPLFCIGTEYRKAVVQRSEFWKRLISEVRDIYKGKITYAANWDNYQNIDFWSSLDYIGIDGYFPLSEEKTPSVAQINEAWKAIKFQLAEFASEADKQIIFTEFGYQSRNYATDGHWKEKEVQNLTNLSAQANAYESIFQSLWSEEWFAGGFLWKWHSAHHKVGGENCNEYTPQNKPAEQVIQDFFAKQ